jgi:hypothetical protein
MRALFALGLVLFAALSAVAAPKEKPKKLDPKLAYLEIVCSVAGAKITIDSVEIGQTPLAEPVVVEPGKHTVRVQKIGHSEYADVAIAVGGKLVSVNADIFPIQGYLRVAVNNLPEGVEAKVYIDERFVGKAPYEGELKNGKHLVEVRSFEYFDFRKEVAVTPGQEYPFSVDLEKLPDALNPKVSKGRGVEAGLLDTRSGQIMVGGVAAGGTIGATLLTFFLLNRAQGCDFSLIRCRGSEDLGVNP